MDRQTKEMDSFLEFADISEDEEDLYRRDPLFFFPQHCYDFRNQEQMDIDESEQEGTGSSRNRTAIGYVKNGNRIEAEFLNQLQIILAKQYETKPDLYHSYQFLKFEN